MSIGTKKLKKPLVCIYLGMIKLVDDLGRKAAGERVEILYSELPITYQTADVNLYHAEGRQHVMHLTPSATDGTDKIVSPDGGRLSKKITKETWPSETMKVYDIKDSVLMGIDVIGTTLELKSENPVTVGGKANKRYLEYVRSFVPEEYEPHLNDDIRVKKYFQKEGLEVAPLNVYAGWMATFLSWIFLPITQPINLYNFARSKRQSQKP